MLEFVEKLLNSQDNIIDQLQLLRENKDNKEVKKYMRALVKDNNSPYFKYCIDKYYFNKDVKEVKPSIRPLRSLYHLKETQKIQRLLESRNNIIDQLKLLKEYKGTKYVDTYIKEYLELWSNEYEAYCIQKYYYDMDVKEVEPNAKSLNITLYRISFRETESKQEKDKQNGYAKSVKKNDKIKILDGPFKNQIGIVNSFDRDNSKIFVTISLFEEKFNIEYDGKFEKIKEAKSEK